MLIAVLLTSHNRKAQTLECLQRLFEQELPAGWALAVYLVIDGSSDGSDAAVAAAFPTVKRIQGDGNLYWCGGMRLAWSVAAQDNPDGYLWLNDDTVLLPGALGSLNSLLGDPGALRIAVGAIGDPDTRVWTYGGVDCQESFPHPQRQPRRCRTLNGNCVLVTRQVYEKIGGFYPGYQHSMGDLDYGYKASRNAIPIVESAGFVGWCRRNSQEGTWRDRSLPLRQRWRKLHSPKGLPVRDWMSYCRRNTGLLWPLSFCSPYIKVALGL